MHPPTRRRPLLLAHSFTPRFHALASCFAVRSISVLKHQKPAAMFAPFDWTAYLQAALLYFPFPPGANDSQMAIAHVSILGQSS